VGKKEVDESAFDAQRSFRDKASEEKNKYEIKRGVRHLTKTKTRGKRKALEEKGRLEWVHKEVLEKIRETVRNVLLPLRTLTGTLEKGRFKIYFPVRSRRLSHKLKKVKKMNPVRRKRGNFSGKDSPSIMCSHQLSIGKDEAMDMKKGSLRGYQRGFECLKTTSLCIRKWGTITAKIPPTTCAGFAHPSRSGKRGGNQL